MDHDSPTARNGAKGDRKDVIHHLYPSKRGEQHRPPKQVRSLPRGFPFPLRAQPENSPLIISRENKQTNKNPAEKKKKSNQNKTNPQTNKQASKQKPHNPQPHISSPNFAQRSCWCQHLREPAPLPSRLGETLGVRAEPT